MHEHKQEMTALRDTLAGHALAGAVAYHGTNGFGDATVSVLARRAYKIADAMLTERARVIAAERAR